MMNRYQWIWLSFVLLLLWAAPVAAAPLADTSYQLFVDDVTGDYLCTRDMTLRYPERCPSFSPGGRKVRLEYLRTQLPDPLPVLPVEELEAEDGAVTEFTFAYVSGLPAYTYAHPAEAEAGLEPQRAFQAGDNWVSVMGRTDYNGQVWYEINPGEFVQEAHLRFANPSRFSGVVLHEQPQYPFAWINQWVQASSVPGGASTGETLSRYQVVAIFAQEPLGSDLWYMVGADQWVEQSFVSRVDVDPRPEGVAPGEKWIEVNTFEQTLAAYEGDRMVFATLVSSGRPHTWTPNGLTRIWSKLPSAPMTNQDSGPASPAWYYLEDVQWTQYFNGAYALHTAYWHDAFSFTRSHGCVNLSPLDAKWLFDWTAPYAPEDARIVMSSDSSPGTWVWVHKTAPTPELALR
ncbi:MAG: L,D-transpeptidase [Anaerolineae bacterium]|nr:L,D-transpeptidase [Anaerolineae bacterium]